MKLRIHRKKIIQYGITIAVVGIVVSAGVIAGVNYVYRENLKPVNNEQRLVEIVIPSGSTVKDIAQLLQDKQLIRNQLAFERYVRNNNVSEDIKAGTYELSPSYHVEEIVSILTNGKIVNKLITILPGARLDQVRRTLQNSGYTEEQINAALDPANYTNHPALVDKPAEASLEGYLYPESFQRTAETDAITIITKSLNEMQKRLTPQLREAFSRQGLSVHRAVILASIVEREVSDPTDREQVAQVFLRRLSIGMKLQSDATAKYGAVLDGKPDLSYSDNLRYSSPYNTYENVGLPPGPVSNVSESSLKAVANPASTDWLFFVSGDDGKTYFSRTLEEHEALTAQYCTELCAN
jgi:UPF0755 protein